MDQNLIIVTSVLSSVLVAVVIAVAVLYTKVTELRKKVDEMHAAGRIRVQKLKMDSDKNHAFHNPALVPEEELSRRGYSMYMGQDNDVESQRGHERQTGGQFVEELTRELDIRQERQAAPPFLLQSIEESKRRSRQLANPVANGRQSDTNPNFIY